VQPLPDKVVIEGIVQTLIPPAARKAIIAAAQRGCGAARDLPGLLALAKQAKAAPRVVCAAFGFLPDYRRRGRYVDMLTDDEFTLGLLPKYAAVRAAFALSRAVHPEGCSFVAERI